MIQTLIRYLVVFGLLFSFGFYVHSFFLGKEAGLLSFSLKKVYSLNTVFSFFLCYLLYLLSGFNNLKDLLGFIYLAALLGKAALFSTMFSPVLFEQETLSLTEKISFIIPLFIFLIVEVYFVAKILKKIDVVK